MIKLVVMSVLFKKVRVNASKVANEVALKRVLKRTFTRKPSDVKTAIYYEKDGSWVCIQKHIQGIQGVAFHINGHKLIRCLPSNKALLHIEEVFPGVTEKPAENGYLKRPALCAGTTKKGTPCKNKRRAGGDYCKVHDNPGQLELPIGETLPH